MKALRILLFKVISLLLFRQAVVASTVFQTTDCSPFLTLPADETKTTCASSMNPIFGPEVGGTVIKIDNGNFQGCPLRPDATIRCRFENNDGTFQDVEGIIVMFDQTNIVECISPFSGERKDVRVSYYAVMNGCESEEATKFEVEEEFMYSGYHAGLLVANNDDAFALAPYTFGNYAAYCVNSATSGIWDEPPYYHIGTYSATNCLIEAKLRGYNFVHYWSEDGLCRGLYTCPFEFNCEWHKCLENDLGVRTYTLSNYDPSITRVTPKQVFFVGNTIEVEWNADSLELSASRDYVQKYVTVNVEILAYTLSNKGEWMMTYGPTEEQDPSLWSIGSKYVKQNGEWNDYTFYVRRECNDCESSHQTIIYKRLTKVPTTMDVKDLFLSNWFDTDNVIGVDFNLYSTFEDAQMDTNEWKFCNYNDPGIGFPRDCAPESSVGHQWNSIIYGVRINVVYYLWHANPSNTMGPFSKIHSFDALPTGSNKQSFVLSDSIISPNMMAWGSNGGEVAVILVRVVASHAIPSIDISISATEVTDHARFRIPSYTPLVCEYGNYILVDRFDSFWTERDEMGYHYHQRAFKTAKDMLDWAYTNSIDWGWKEPWNYAQLFWLYKETHYYPSFGDDIDAIPASNCNLHLKNPYPDIRVGFVSKIHLLHHASWANTPARSSYLAQISSGLFVLGSPGENTCPTGSSHIKDEDICRQANDETVRQRDYLGIVSTGTPQGCYWDTFHGETYMPSASHVPDNSLIPGHIHMTPICIKNNSPFVLGSPGKNTCPIGSFHIKDEDICRQANDQTVQQPSYQGIVSAGTPQGCYSDTMHKRTYMPPASHGPGSSHMTPICIKNEWILATRTSRLIGVFPKSMEENNTFQCNSNYNFIIGIPYDQISLTDGCDSEGVCNANPIYTEGEAGIRQAISYCKKECKVSRSGCVGFFFQRHDNGHEICGFYDQDMTGGSWIRHGHQDGSTVCMLNEECPFLPNKECTHVTSPCPPSHDIALIDDSFSPDETCIWPSGNYSCDLRLDLEVDFLATCFNANTCDVDLSDFHEHSFYETDGCPCASSHHMATGCVSNGLTQCCYAESGALITEYNDGAGRPTCDMAIRYEPVVSFLYDRLPYLLCCGLNELDNSCKSFLNDLPAITTDDPYTNPTTAAISFGDPHIISFDRINYNFNGYGEFVAACGAPLKFSDDEVRNICNTSPLENNEHIRIHYRFKPLSRNIQGHTVIKGISIQDPTFHGGTKNLIIIAHDNDRLRFYVGSNVIKFDGIKARFRMIKSDSNARIARPRRTDRKNGKKFNAIIKFKSGLKIKISEVEGILNPTISRPHGYNNFMGLLGQGNVTNKADSFKSPNGAYVPIDIVEDKIKNTFTAPDEKHVFYKFGKAWEIDKDKRILSMFGSIEHIPGHRFNDFYHPNWEPDFDNVCHQEKNTGVYSVVVPNKKRDENNHARQLQRSVTDAFCAEYENTFVRQSCISDICRTTNEDLVRSTSDFAQEQEYINRLLLNSPPVVRNDGRLRRQRTSLGVNEDATFQMESFDTDGDNIIAELTRNDNNLFELTSCQLWKCDGDYISLLRAKYKEIYLHNGCMNGVCNHDVELVVAYCKKQCKVATPSCNGFSYQRQDNGYDICRLYQDTTSGKWEKHRYAKEGSGFCNYKTCAYGSHEVRFLGSGTAGNFRAHVTFTDSMTPVLAAISVKVSAPPTSALPNNPTTSEPTPSPTSVPTVTNLFIPEAPYCIQDPSVDCAAITYNEKRRYKACKKVDIKIKCPSSCGLCCTDNTSFTFKIKSKTRNCRWIANQFHKRKRHCNKKKVKANCQLACNKCLGPI